MCGVAGGWGGVDGRAVAALRHRGPDAEGLTQAGPWWLAHTRMAVLDLDRRSDQPFRRGHVALSYNGELFNWRALRAELEVLGECFETDGDTEVLAAMLDRHGAAALPSLAWMGAVAWVDDRDGMLRLARDPFGEVPLHVALDGRGGRLERLTFASERKALRALSVPRGRAFDVEPGQVLTFRDPAAVPGTWRYYDPPSRPLRLSLEEAAPKLREVLLAGVNERSIADVPRCVLLSGGIDSAAIAKVLADQGPGLVAYAAVMDPASPDLRAARLLAGELGLELREVKVPAPTADDLGSTVEAIELQSKAQVEIGWACLHLARAIRADGFRVTFSGEGSDELWASYGMSYHGVKAKGWHPYRKGLVLGEARKNFPRVNKAFMSAGVEARLPFLHRPLVELALGLPQDAVQLPGRPKAVLQEALRGLLPEAILMRRKLAFQDGTGMKDAAARAVADPRRFYAAEYARRF
jgi:asparagine synthase (glutamine-hydrolysing)